MINAITYRFELYHNIMSNNKALINNICILSLEEKPQTSPRSTTKRKRLTHTIPKISTIRSCLWLIYHNTRSLGIHCKFHDIFLRFRVDATTVSLTLIRLDAICQRSRFIKILFTEIHDNHMR